MAPRVTIPQTLIIFRDLWTECPLQRCYSNPHLRSEKIFDLHNRKERSARHIIFSLVMLNSLGCPS